MGAKTVVWLLLAITACKTEAGSVLDIFPATGAASKVTEATCTFEYEPSGSTWIEGVDEQSVFLASMKSDDWCLGVGKGGHIYSLRGPYGESIPPQRVPSPWNDEVWQSVVTSEELIAPVQDYQNANRDKWDAIWNATFPLMYFVHQAGIYTKGAGTDGGAVAAPFYSPCLRKRWNPETRTLELVNWMQQARTPCVWKSGVLIYTAYRDLGRGILEVNQVLHNFGDETLTFLNTPWGGVRKSSLPRTLMSNADGTRIEVDGMYGWTDIPTRYLVNTGGWTAWTQDPGDNDSPSLALVFGTDLNDVSNGKRRDESIRWGTAGEEERDYQVAERISHARVATGDSLSVRWFLVSGELSDVCDRAAELAPLAGVSFLDFDHSARQPVWIANGEVSTDGKGRPWVELLASPAKGSIPVFLIKDRRTGKKLITTDIYALAETEPFPNPLPEHLEFHDLYDDRVIYKQYEPHIGYETLLGYAYPRKPEDMGARKLAVSESPNLVLEEELWVPVTAE